MWTTNDHNNHDIRERTKKINDIGERLTHFFQDCAAKTTNITPTGTDQLVTHFSIAIQSPDMALLDLQVNILGNGKVQLRNHMPSQNKSSTIHEFEIRTNYDLNKVFSHTVFEMALDEVCATELKRYGIDIVEGIKLAQDSFPPAGKQRTPALPPQRTPNGKGIQP